MKISRHARNNMRLYQISREEIETTIAAPDSTDKEEHGEIAYKLFPDRFGTSPLKVVYVLEDDEPFVITAYPLRQAHWRK
ncbi:MAG: DUF4258 domain-containing protein [Deltaproteobacteria bacterium]|nr:DUF4258 domain-containing protein [Deltaproteobacteria bacterium]